MGELQNPGGVSQTGTQLTPAEVRAKIARISNKTQMNDLSQFRFTNSHDIALGVNGLFLRYTDVVNTLAEMIL